MKNANTIIIISILLLVDLCSCNNPTSGKKEMSTQDTAQIGKQKNIYSFNDSTLVISFSVAPDASNIKLPALQSCISAVYNNLWVFIGGEKKGFHGTASYPHPFPSKVANDSIWVVDIVHQQSWSVAVPRQFKKIMSATNAAFYQQGDTLFMCGGFTKNADSAKHLNYTSDYFLQIDLNSLIQYVQSGGKSVPLTQVITKQIEDPYLQVTGGAMIYSNGYFYLVGGQNYKTIYAAGTTGTYTNAIRKFTLQQLAGKWVISDTASLIDSINLHRRDMNVVSFPGNNQPQAILYGGVFTKRDEAFRNPILINGLSSGQPSITADSLEQSVNQYSCATLSFSADPSGPVITFFFGGISYKMYDTATRRLVIGDHGIPMPFSNIISAVVSDGVTKSKEFFQLPGNGPLLPAYMGTDAVFMLNQDTSSNASFNGNRHVLELNKVMKIVRGSQVLIGYLFGGIISLGPTSGTTANGNVPTYANPVLYDVYLNFNNQPK